MNKLYFIAFIMLTLSCSKDFTNLKFNTLDDINEFEKLVKVEPDPAAKKNIDKIKFKKKEDIKPKKKQFVKRKENKKIIKKKKVKLMKHEPDIEDSQSFVGRRPLVDPFSVDEETVLDLTYLNMSAGTMHFRVRPFAIVNGRKSYKFELEVKTSKLFSMFYRVKNLATTFVDYELILPSSHVVMVNESKQKKESRSFYNWETNQAKFWEKKIVSDGQKNSKKDWELKPYSQNVISSFFYMRVFELKKDKVIKFRIGDAGKNILFKAKVLREEKLKTVMGVLDTYVLKPEVEVNGTFKPIGDVFIWLTKDKSKKIVKIESKIKIGTIIAELKSFK